MNEGRPDIGVGHVTLDVSDVARSEAFYRSLGMRPIVLRDALAILEMRGGTHLLLFAAKVKPTGGPVHGFDLMVDDVPALRGRLAQSDVDVSPIEEDARGGHLFFNVTDPDGHVLTVYSSHAGDRVV